ncbi:hypothetical protein BC936DRAFT_149704 [Jimgerdemannia flammicorona]|uniref:C3H1-type domain-containing protein n=1 Tax=Jimgerdemannia flammicorona TaxID=994334 RepID=A0A433D0A2_9FUNG|nr:hypothetical protein BC936DRAFT_149704 [Jimgerdemannia flammicorona]
METPQTPRLPRNQFRKLKKKEKRKNVRQDLASRRGALEHPAKADSEEPMDIDGVDDVEHEKQRKLWEAREEAYNKANAIKRQIEEAERKKKEIVQQNWEKAVHSIAVAQLSAVKTVASSSVRKPAKPLTFVPGATTNSGDGTLETCLIYTKTGACRNGSACTRHHQIPTRGTIIMICNMYEGMASKLADVENDERLEVCVWVYPWLIPSHLGNFIKSQSPSIMNVFHLLSALYITKQVCKNHSPHLRGNVYVQYATETDTAAALEATRGRWYGGRRLTCDYVPVTKWKMAICGQFDRGRCSKHKQCNYLHPYRNPGGLYGDADRDFEHGPNSIVDRTGSAAMAVAAAAAASISAALQRTETEVKNDTQSRTISVDKTYPDPPDPPHPPGTSGTDHDTRLHKDEGARHRRRSKELDRHNGNKVHDRNSSRGYNDRDRDSSKERHHSGRKRSPSRTDRHRYDRRSRYHDGHRSRRRSRSRSQEKGKREAKQQRRESKDALNDRQNSRRSPSPVYRLQSPEYRPQSPEYRPQSSEYRPQSSEYRPQLSEYRPQSPPGLSAEAEESWGVQRMEVDISGMTKEVAE